MKCGYFLSNQMLWGKNVVQMAATWLFSGDLCLLEFSPVERKLVLLSLASHFPAHSFLP